MDNTAELGNGFNRDRYFTMRQSYIDRHLDRLSHILPQSGMAVDIGCGEGPGVVALAKRGFSVIGIDIDLCGNVLPFAEEKARSEGLNTKLIEGGNDLVPPPQGEALFVRGDAQIDLKLSDGSVDLVTSFYTAGPSGVYEIPWKKIYAECGRIVNSSGMIVVTTEQEKNTIEIIKFLSDAGVRQISKSETANTVDRYVVIAKK